jgi:hypothetical protein
MSDNVKRLRERAGHYDEYGWHDEIEREAADIIERLGQLTEWQPIETVPRSGTVLIFVPDMAEGERVISSQFWRIENEHSKSVAPKYVFFAGVDGPDSDIYGATRWMPLPDEPIDK